MVDADQFVLCEHDREPGECAICGGEVSSQPPFDSRAALTRYLALADEADTFLGELAGVPFS